MSFPVAGVAGVCLAVLFAVAVAGSIGRTVSVSATAIRSRTIPDLAEEIPWGAAGIG
ncbi:MAG: hypothetical protein LBJ02_05445 [Bifidobacteriaceae bacterium]|jgi:hypothetical protein|nr:hypothetical protein [Bifidobacteriaceae bacterium]